MLLKANIFFFLLNQLEIHLNVLTCVVCLTSLPVFFSENFFKKKVFESLKNLFLKLFFL